MRDEVLLKPNLMHHDFKKYLVDLEQASACEEVEIIQSLWSGYGTISRYKLEGAGHDTVVVKCISSPEVMAHPRGWNTDKSHARKAKSYEVETHWYTHFNQWTNTMCRTPEFLGAYAASDNQWIVLEDMDANFPLRKQELSLSEVKVCLQWLANFHATYLGYKPSGLWEIGSYWHLGTRPEEWNKTEHPELKAKAYRIDEILNNCVYQTLIHGDAKVANFCFSEDSKEVAAVDFQYTGGGCGMKDVAYLLGSCMSGDDCKKHESELLDYYFSELKYGMGTPADSIPIEAEWRQMYPLAVADFMRFLLGWMPTHPKVNAYSLNLTEEVLIHLT